MSITQSPKVILNTVINESPSTNQVAGVYYIQGITDFGIPETPTLISSWTRFKELYGGESLNTRTPTYCRRILEQYGGTIRFSRLTRYSAPATPILPTETGSIGTSPDSIDFTASILGNYTMQINVVESLDTLSWNITLYIQGYQSATTRTANLPKTATASEILQANEILQYAEVTAVNGLGATGSVSITVTDDTSLYTDTDYLGDEGDGSGLHAFNEFSDGVAVCSPENDSEVYILGLQTYVENRKDIAGIWRAPEGLNATSAIAFRNGTAPYSHTPFNSFYTMGFWSDIEIPNPFNTTERWTISGVGDFIGVLSRKDKNLPNQKHVSPASEAGGYELGGILKLVENVGTTAKESTRDALSTAGYNYFIRTSDGILINFEDRTMGITTENNPLQTGTTMLLTLYIAKNINRIAQKYLKAPQVIQTGRQLDVQVEKFMQNLADQNSLVAFVVNGHKRDGVYTVSDLKTDGSTLNTPQDFSDRRYKMEVVYAPTDILRTISILESVNNLSSFFTITTSEQ